MGFVYVNIFFFLEIMENYLKNKKKKNNNVYLTCYKTNKK